MSITICSFLRLISDSHTVTHPLKDAAAEPPHLDNLSHILHFRGSFRHSAKSQGSACLVPHDTGKQLPTNLYPQSSSG